MNKCLFNNIVKIKALKNKVSIILIHHLVKKQKYSFNIKKQVKNNLIKIYNKSLNRIILKIQRQHKYKLI